MEHRIQLGRAFHRPGWPEPCTHQAPEERSAPPFDMEKDRPQEEMSASPMIEMPRPATTLFVEAVSPSMRSVEGVIRELAGKDLPVLLVAELGAGKHAAARLIHEMSPRKSESFQAVSCLSLTSELLKSSAQALWGAGTVYLEELADLPKPA